jgi:hypothetical protein
VLQLIVLADPCCLDSYNLQNCRNIIRMLIIHTATLSYDRTRQKLAAS